VNPVLQSTGSELNYHEWSTTENNDLQKIKLLDYIVHTKRIVGTNDPGVRSDNRTVSAMTDAAGVAFQGSRFL
jgi:hypothetical protein